jgi:hypothetical protein
MSTPVQYRRNTQQTRKKSRENETKNVDDSGGAHCISSTVVVTSFVRIERSNRKVRVTKRNEKRNENFITKVRAMMAMLMMKNIFYNDDVFYFFDVVDIDHRLLTMMMMMKSVNVNDFDYYRVVIVCDDDDDFCDGDDDDVYEISSSFSFSYLSLTMMLK